MNNITMNNNNNRSFWWQLFLWTCLYAVFCVAMALLWGVPSSICPDENNDGDNNENGKENVVDCQQQQQQQHFYRNNNDHSTMAWTTVLFVAAVTATLAFSLLVRIDDEKNATGNRNKRNPTTTKSSPSPSSWAHYLPGAAMALWSISLACRGILSSSMTFVSVYDYISKIVETTVQVLAILILGVLMQTTTSTTTTTTTTSTTTTTTSKEMEERPKTEHPKQRRILLKQEQQQQQQQSSCCNMKSLRLLAWVVLIAATLIIVACSVALVLHDDNNNNNDDDDDTATTTTTTTTTMQLRFYQAALWIYAVAVTLFMVNVAYLWCRHARILLLQQQHQHQQQHQQHHMHQTTATILSSARLLLVVLMSQALYRIGSFLVLQFVVWEEYPIQQRTQHLWFNAHTAISSYFVLIAAVLIHNILLALFQLQPSSFTSQSSSQSSYSVDDVVVVETRSGINTTRIEQQRKQLQSATGEEQIDVPDNDRGRTETTVELQQSQYDYGNHPDLQYSSAAPAALLLTTATAGVIPFPTRINSIRKSLLRLHPLRQKEQLSPTEMEDADRKSLEMAVSATTAVVVEPQMTAAAAAPTSRPPPSRPSWLSLWKRKHGNEKDEHAIQDNDHAEEPSLVTEIAHNLTNTSQSSKKRAQQPVLRTNSKYNSSSSNNNNINPYPPTIHRADSQASGRSTHSTAKSVQWDASVVEKESSITLRRKRLALLLRQAACFDVPMNTTTTGTTGSNTAQEDHDSDDVEPSMLEIAVESGFGATMAAIDAVFKALDGGSGSQSNSSSGVPVPTADGRDDDDHCQTSSTRSEAASTTAGSDVAIVSSLSNSINRATLASSSSSSPPQESRESDFALHVAASMAEEADIAKGFFADLTNFLLPNMREREDASCSKTNSKKTKKRTTRSTNNKRRNDDYYVGNDIESGVFVPPPQSPLVACTDTSQQVFQQTRMVTNCIVNNALSCSDQACQQSQRGRQPPQTTTSTTSRVVGKSDDDDVSQGTVSTVSGSDRPPSQEEEDYSYNDDGTSPPDVELALSSAAAASAAAATAPTSSKMVLHRSNSTGSLQSHTSKAPSGTVRKLVQLWNQ